MTTIRFCVRRMALCLGVLLLPSLSALGQEHGVGAKSARPPSIEGALPIGAGAFLQLELALGSEWKRVAKNSTVEGRLLLPVFAGAGSLYLRIERITSPEGSSLAIAGTLSGVEVEAHAHWALDEEGMLRGLRPGVKNAIVDLSIAYAIGKVTDDIAETPIRAIVATMSDAAVANAARYFGLGASAVFLVTRHGRDVNLPRYAHIQIDFGRHGEEIARRSTCD